MAKKKEQEVKGDQRLENIEETLTQTEVFILKNQKLIGIIVGAIVVIILGYFGYQRYYIEPKTTEALEQMYVAQRYFEADSLDKALYGDGNALGFIDIVDEFSMTKPGNLANYYAGISFLKKKDFDLAIDYLGDFKAGDHFIGPILISCKPKAKSIPEVVNSPKLTHFSGNGFGGTLTLNLRIRSLIFVL